MAAADRSKQKIEDSRSIIEDFYCLQTKSPVVYPDQRAVEIGLVSPKGQSLGMIELWWDQDGNIAPERVMSRARPLEGVDELKIAIKKLKDR